jgi:sortase B
MRTAATNRKFLGILGAALVAAAIAMLVYIAAGYISEDNTNQEIREMYGNNPSESADNTSEEAEDEYDWASESVWPDIAGLKEVNSEVIGWVRFDGETYIDYPIMYTGEDNKYLHTDIYGNESKSGCIFLEGSNSPDLSDYHSILYGHNMKNLSMFGNLKKYKTEDYYEDHQYFTIYLENTAYRYRIFAYYDIDENDSVYTVGFGPNDEYKEFIDTMYRRAYYDTGVTATEQDKVVTLSTCSTTGKRFVVHGVNISTNERAW